MDTAAFLCTVKSCTQDFARWDGPTQKSFLSKNPFIRFRFVSSRLILEARVKLNANKMTNKQTALCVASFHHVKTFGQADFTCFLNYGFV